MSDTADFAHWLDGQPEPLPDVILLRAAMRLVPWCAGGSTQQFSVGMRQGAEATLIALAKCWVDLAQLKSPEWLADPQGEVAYGLREKAIVLEFPDVKKNEAFEAIRATLLSLSSTRPVESPLLLLFEAATEIGGRAFAFAITRDSELLRNGADLRFAPLWSEEHVDAVEHAWLPMRVALLAGGVSIRHRLVHWYQERLDGIRPPAKAAPPQLSCAPLGYAQPEVGLNSRVVENGALFDDEIAPVPGPYVFERHGARMSARIRLGKPSDVALARGTVEGCLRHVRRLQQDLSGNNTDSVLADIMVDLIADLGDPDALPVGQLLVALSALQAQEALYDDPAREADFKIRARIKAVVDPLQTLLAEYPEVRDLEASRIVMGISDGATVGHIRAAIHDLASAAAVSPVIDTSVPRALERFDPEVMLIDETIRARRASLSRLQTLTRKQRDIMGHMIVTAQGVTSETMLWHGSESKRSDETADSAAATDSAAGKDSGGTRDELLALVLEFSEPANALAEVAQAFEPLAKRLQAIREEVESQSAKRSDQGIHLDRG